MNKHILLLNMALAAMAAFTLTACSDEEEPYNASQTSEGASPFITFRLPESTETRSQDGQDRTEPKLLKKTTLKSSQGKPLFLSVKEYPSFDEPDTRDTRGTQVYSLSSFNVSASIYEAASTYTAEQQGSYFFDESFSPSTSTGYYWPSASYKLSFYAYSPAGDGNFTLSSTATTVGSPVYAYTVPATVSQQVDILTAQVTDHLGGAQGALTLPFAHRCAAIKVNFTNDGENDLTVKSVSITGVKYVGTLQNTTWTLSSTVNSASSHPFTLTVNQLVEAGETESLTTSPDIFLMLPQTLLTGASMTVTMSDNTEYVADIAGTTWTAGYTYNYNISVSDAYDFYLDITEPAAVTYAGGSSTYGIKSYKENAGGSQKAVAWTATYSTDGGNTFTSTRPTWLTTFTTSGDGGTSFSNYTATVMAQSSSTRSGTPAALLKANPTVSNYDLSLHDTQGNTVSMTTANCYMVHAPGTYRIPLVYGNAIKGGTLNEEAYNPTGTSGTNFLKPFLNHAGSGITAPWITKSNSGTGVDKGMGIAVTGASLVWQDVQNMISAVGQDGDYLTFTVSDMYIAEGNAVIAATNSDGIVWSWHIWVTNETFSNLTTINATHTYCVTPVNLGWVNKSSSSTVTGYAGRSCLVKITQTGTGGLEQTFTITQNASLTAATATQGYNTYYQWGRKDPEIPHNGTNQSSTDHTIWNSSATVTSSYSQSSVPIATTIKNPLTHYYNSSNYGPYSTSQYNLWDAQNTSTAGNITTKTNKTVYDPCPPGFCVPTGNLFYFMTSNGGSNSSGSWTSTSQNQGRTWSADTPNLFFPASGCRYYSNGSLYNVGSSGYCCSASPYRTGNARYMYFTSSYWDWSNGNRAYGFSVRAVREE